MTKLRSKEKRKENRNSNERKAKKSWKRRKDQTEMQEEEEKSKADRRGMDNGKGAELCVDETCTLDRWRQVQGQSPAASPKGWDWHLG